MRFSSEKLELIKQVMGEYTIDPNVKLHYTEDGKVKWTELSQFFRFGYWERIDVKKFESLLPNGMIVVEEFVDETDEGMSLWGYTVKDRY